MFQVIHRMSVHIACTAIVLFFNLSFNILSCSNVPRPKTELYDAFIQFLQFSPMLLGYNFTEQDEALFAAGRKQDDVHLSIEEIIVKYGYSVEKHEVTTEDGYILILFRIRASGPPVLLLHGLTMSADEWVTPGPETGLAFLLAAEGYDVWLGNARGNKYSHRHLTLSPESAEFWNFSWDEIGRYDLPAMITYILNSTYSHQLVYIGHSQGTTSFFVMASEKPEYNDKISLMVALAPAADISNLKSPIIQFINYLTLLYPQKLLALLRKKVFNLSLFNNPILETIASIVCGRSEIATALCHTLIFAISGFNYSQLNITRLPVILLHLSSEISVKQLEHYAQIIGSRRFQKFDYGATRNIFMYGSRIPPEYNVNAINTSVSFFYSSGDWLASEIDVKVLSQKLPNVNLYRIPDKHFTHLDFLFAKDLHKLIFKPLLKLLKNKAVIK